jgi:predicted ThiF/HesA family dinucleotide-utilizing enzyme
MYQNGKGGRKMIKWEALYMPGQNGEDEKDPSRAGFNSFEEAVNYVRSWLCEDCKQELKNRFAVVELAEGEDTIPIESALETMCGEQWLVQKYES